MTAWITSTQSAKPMICKLRSKLKWKSGLELMKNLAQISVHMQHKDAENPAMEASLKKMDKMYADNKQRFEENLIRIKDSNYSTGTSLSRLTDLQKHEGEDMQQAFVSDVDIQEIKEQHFIVEERQQNILELQKALNSIQNMGQKIHELTVEDNTKIDNILKNQKNHKEDLETKINMDIYTTHEVNKRTCRKLVCFGFVALLLLCGVIYWTIKILKNNDPSPNPDPNPIPPPPPVPS